MASVIRFNQEQIRPELYSSTPAVNREEYRCIGLLRTLFHYQDLNAIESKHEDSRRGEFEEEEYYFITEFILPELYGKIGEAVMLGMNDDLKDVITERLADYEIRWSEEKKKFVNEDGENMVSDDAPPAYTAN